MDHVCRYVRVHTLSIIDTMKILRSAAFHTRLLLPSPSLMASYIQQFNHCSSLLPVSTSLLHAHQLRVETRCSPVAPSAPQTGKIHSSDGLGTASLPMYPHSYLLRPSQKLVLDFFLASSPSHNHSCDAMGTPTQSQKDPVSVCSLDAKMTSLFPYNLVRCP